MALRSIPWDEPMRVRQLGGELSGLACRLCVAHYGLRGRDIGKLFQTRDEWEQHMEQFHADAANGPRE